MMQFKELDRQRKQLDEERIKMTKDHQEYLLRDTQEIFSAIALCMIKKGHKRAKVEKFISDVCQEWWTAHEIVQNIGITVADYCAEQTGLDIREMIPE